jgi:hypothetical protein
MQKEIHNATTILMGAGFVNVVSTIIVKTAQKNVAPKLNQPNVIVGIVKIKMNYQKLIQKMNRETCYKNLKDASSLIGNETEKELEDIYNKCLNINGINLLNDMREQAGRT